jgi:hypothetical protein
MWAVVDHNSEFAIVPVPEPATWLLLAAAAAGRVAAAEAATAGCLDRVVRSLRDRIRVESTSSLARFRRRSPVTP